MKSIIAIEPLIYQTKENKKKKQSIKFVSYNMLCEKRSREHHISVSRKHQPAFPYSSPFYYVPSLHSHAAKHTQSVP